MKFSIPIIFSILLLAACGQQDEPEHTEPHTYMEQEADMAHNARNSLDYDGVYEGVVPCADCAGIDTRIEIDQEGNYSLEVQYLGKDDDTVHRFEGTYVWNDAGSTITLGGVEDRPNQFFVAENRLIQLDMDGNRITGELADEYILPKKETY